MKKVRNKESIVVILNVVEKKVNHSNNILQFSKYIFICSFIVVAFCNKYVT